MNQLLIGMAGPDLGRGKAQNVKIDHGFGLAKGYRSHVTGEEPGTHQFVSAIGEGDKDEIVMARLPAQTLIESRQQRCSAPVVEWPSRGRSPIVVCAHDHALIT